MFNKIRHIIVNIIISVIAIFIFCFILDKFIASTSYSIVKDLPFVLNETKSSYCIGLKPNFNGRFTTAEYNISIKTNSLGFRDKEFKIIKPKNVFRILCLGDSFTFGQGVESPETYPKVLEGILNKEAYYKDVYFEVINAGWVASDPKEQLYFLKNYGLKLNPDIVTIGFFTGNDIVELLSNGMKETDSIDFQANFVTALKLRTGPVGIFRAQFEKYFPNLYEFLSLRIIKLIYKMGGHRHIFDYILQRDYPKIIDAGWKEALNCYREMNQLTREANAKLFVIIIPFREQIKNEHYNNNYIVDKPQRIIKDFLLTEKIPFCDLLPALERCDVNKTYFLKDGHWRKYGHFIVAREISNELVESLNLEILKRRYGNENNR